MMNPENKSTVNPTTDVQESKPDAFDKFAAWAKPQLTRLGSFLWDNKEFFAQVALADMDSRRTQRNVRRVIEQRQEIERHCCEEILTNYPTIRELEVGR